MHEVIEGKLTMSTGVVFRIADVPVMAFEAAKKQLVKERPQVPVCYIEEKARDEPNPNDPSYIAAVEDFESKLFEKLIDVAIMLGITADKLPKEFPSAESKQWTKPFELLGIPIPNGSKVEERFLSWVKLRAAPTVEDMQSLVLACSRNAGVTEEDVADSATMFRNRAERRANRGT